MSQPIVKVQASTPRRYFAMAVIASLGGLLIYLAATAPMTFGGRIMLAGCGIGALYMCDRLRRATLGWLELRDEGLVDQNGTVLAPVDQIVGIDRGHLAIKPSNGFVVRMTERAPRAWAPGLWWRSGRRLGVGGATSAAQAKVMADAISTMLAERKA